jgi:hypothetical protein
MNLKYMENNFVIILRAFQNLALAAVVNGMMFTFLQMPGGS